jgi:hypothetical protein
VRPCGVPVIFGVREVAHGEYGVRWVVRPEKEESRSVSTTWENIKLPFQPGISREVSYKPLPKNNRRAREVLTSGCRFSGIFGERCCSTEIDRRRI